MKRGTNLLKSKERKIQEREKSEDQTLLFIKINKYKQIDCLDHLQIVNQ